MISSGRTVCAVGLVLAAAMVPAAVAAPSKAPTPSLQILSFRYQVPPGTMVATVGGAAPTAPTSKTIDYSESVTLAWRVKACHMQTVALRLSGASLPNGPRRDEADGCFYLTGNRSVTPSRTTSYVLQLSGSPVASAVAAPAPVQRSFQVIVQKPELDLLSPNVDQRTMTVSLSARNRGDGRFLSNPMSVEWTVSPAPGHHSPAGAPLASGTLAVPAREVRPGAGFDLGSFRIPDRGAALAHDGVQIALRLTPTYPAPLGETRESFNHGWEPQTFTINEGATRLIGMGSTYDIRLNNYGGGGRHVPNDSNISLDVLGHPANFTFTIDRFTHDVLIGGPIPVVDQVAIFVNNIHTSRRGPSNLFFIRDGKLGIHVEFENAASDEIKTGMLFGPRDEWRDGMVADVNISPFALDVLLTPELRNGKVSYGRVEVIATGVDASAVGALDGLINTFFHDYLRRYVRDTIVTYLTQILSSNNVRNSVSDALTNAVGGGTGVTRITGVRGAGNTLVVTYL